MFEECLLCIYITNHS